MNFQDFLKYIPKIEKETLPSMEAHLKMAPLERISLMKENNVPKANLRKAAVMMLFYPKNDITHLALIMRNKYPGIHSSQVAFPGGKVEIEDIDLAHTALRETHEEIGISPNQIKIIRAFSEIYIPPSQFLVSPFMGISLSEIIFNPSEAEVAGMIELPLHHFLDDVNVVHVPMTTSYASEISVPAYKFGEFLVWGATAMMMSELKETIKKVL